MARKFEFDSSIEKDIKAVASDSFVDSIKMINVDLVKPSADNFFSLSEIEVLAEDIERQGLKHNLVVSEDKDQKGTYLLKSGHRRFEAIKFLIAENRLTNKTVPCLVDGIKTKAENMLDLIMLNATTRVMTDAEIMQQYNVLEKTYKELEAEGKKFKGRLRERIAEALQVSSAQVSKIEKINRYAVDEIKEAVGSGEMSISTANDVAKLDEEKQKELVKKKPVKDISSKEAKEKLEQSKPKEEKNTYDVPDNIDEYEETDSDIYIQKHTETSRNISLLFSEINALKLYLPYLLSDLEENDTENYFTLKKLVEKLK